MNKNLKKSSTMKYTLLLRSRNMKQIKTIKYTEDTWRVDLLDMIYYSPTTPNNKGHRFFW